MNRATVVVNAGYGELVQRWLFVLLAIVSFMGAGPAMAGRAHGGLVGGLAGGVLVPPLNAPAPNIPPTFDMIGFLEAATVDPTMCPTVTDPRLKGGTARINGQTIIVPCNTILQMPAFALTWADLFTLAPKDIMPAGSTASGLALGDIMAPLALGLLNTPWTDANTGLPASYNAQLPSHEFHVQGNVIGGQNIAGLIFISQQGLNAGQGTISCIDYATGEMQVGGTPVPHGTTPCPLLTQLAASGQKITRVRMNDPIGRFGIIHGGPGRVGADVIEAGYDPRFTADTDNPTMHSSLGYPICIPTINPVNPIMNPITGAVIAAGNDPLCPMYNRPIAPNCKSFDPLTLIPAFGGQPAGLYCTTWVMDPPGAHALDANATDPTANAPLVIGDTIGFHGTMKADANGPYISAHSIEANLGIYTHPHTQPAYVFMEALGVGTGGGTVGGIAVESTNKVFWVGFSTDPTELVDFYAVHQDPVFGTATEYFLGTQDPCCVPLGRFRTQVNNLGVFGDPQRNYRAVTRTMCQPQPLVPNGVGNGPLTPQWQTRCYMDTPATPDPTAVMATIALNQSGLVQGQYTLPNFLFIFGENLAFGGPIMPANFQDLPFLFCGSGPINGPVTATNPASTVVGQLDPAPWALPMADPVFHSTLCPAVPAVGAAVVVAAPPPPAPKPPVINSVTATPASTIVGALTTVTLTANATNPNTPATPMSYAWTAPAGVVMDCGVCALNAAYATVHATFNPAKAGTLVFTATVANGVLPNATGSASVLVAAATTKAPTIKAQGATPAGTVNVGALVTLSATANTNPAGGTVTVSFTQTGGAAVTLNPVTMTGAAPADQIGKATFSVPFGPATQFTFIATATDTATGLTANSGTITVKTAAPQPDVVAITSMTFRAFLRGILVQSEFGKFNINATSTAFPPPVGMTMTATLVNNTLPANIIGSTALPISMPMLFTQADVPGTLTPVCGPNPCWVGFTKGVIADTTQTPPIYLAPTSVTVRSSFGGTATMLQGDPLYTIR
jgi:hypothetical protein